MAGESKSRYGIFLVYPESAPDDWWERLKGSHGSYARSPLHEPDEDVKKPHYHVIYKHSNTVSLEAMKKVIPEGVPANNYVELCAHPRNYQRYLLHLDDPDKQQWEGDPFDLVETCNGFPLDLTRDYSKEERNQQRKDLIALIRTYELCEYADLIEGLTDSGMFDLLDYACNHTMFCQVYLSSRRNRDKSGKGKDEVDGKEEPAE